MLEDGLPLSKITADYLGGLDDVPLTESEIIDELRRSYWIFRVTSQPSSGQLRPLRLLGILGILPLATVLITWGEGTLFLRQQNGGRGLLEHLGWWAQYLSCPVLVILALQVLRAFAKILSDARFTSASEHETLSVRSFQHALLRRCCGKTTRGKRQIGELFLLGGASVVVNLQTTRTALAVYGEDVWDSNAHPYGYWVGKVFLAFEWGYLLPILAFFALSIGATIHYIVKRTVTHRAQQLSVFAADGCGGYRPLGQLMLRIVYLDVPIATIIVCLHLTHDRQLYFTIVFASCFFLAAVVAQLFLPFIPLHEELSALKRVKLCELEDFLSKHDRALLLSYDPQQATAILAAACVYQQTMQLSTWPYARSDTWKALTPFVPLASLLVRLVIR